jgi:hypothetical protein
MPRASDYLIEGYTYHLTHRCHNRKFLLRFARDRNAFREWMQMELAEEWAVPIGQIAILTNSEVGQSTQFRLPRARRFTSPPRIRPKGPPLTMRCTADWLQRLYAFASHPFDDNYSDRSMHPGQFIPRHMLRHTWFGIAWLCLGISIATFRSVGLLRRVTYYVAVVVGADWVG